MSDLSHLEDQSEVQPLDLSALTKLCEEQVVLEEELAHLEEEVRKKKEALQILSMQTIPDAMMTAGVSSITTSSGDKITAKPFMSARIIKGKEEEAYLWLRDNGLGDIVKNEFKVNYGKGDDAEAMQFSKLLKDNGIDYENKESVHYQTLQATVKEQAEKGVAFPECFNVFQGQKTKVERG